MRYKRIKVYDVIELLEVSPVGIPSYPDAINRSLIKSFNDYERHEKSNIKLNKTERMEMEKQEEIKPEETAENKEEEKAEEQEKPEETAEEEPKKEAPAEEPAEKAVSKEMLKSISEYIAEAFREETEKLKAKKGLVEKKSVNKSIGELAIESGFFRV